MSKNNFISKFFPFGEVKRGFLVLSTSLVLAGAMCAPASAQVSNVWWKKNFGGSAYDQFNSVTSVSGGVVAVGSSGANSFNTGDWTGITGKGADDAIIVKYNNAGTVLWQKNFGGSDYDYYNCVTAVSDGIVAVGYSQTSSFNTGDWTGITGKGSTDAIIVKYDNTGNVVWKKNFGGSNSDRYKFVTTVSDGIVAVGYSYGNSFNNGDWTGIIGNGADDAIIVKYDNAGNVVWKKNFGGSDYDVYNSVTATSDGIVAVGYSNAGSFNNGDWTGYTGKGGVMDAIIVKYDNDGNVVWKKNFGGSDYDEYYSVTKVSDGIVAVGSSSPNSFNNGDWTGITGKGLDDAIIVKYDNDGNVLWKKNLGSSGSDYYYSVMTTSDGIVAVGSSGVSDGDWTGYSGNGNFDAVIVKYDNAGNVVWKNYFGGIVQDYYNCVTATSDGIVAVGYSLPYSFNSGDWTGIAGNGGNDAIIVKYYFIRDTKNTLNDDLYVVNMQETTNGLYLKYLYSSGISPYPSFIAELKTGLVAPYDSLLDALSVSDSEPPVRFFNYASNGMTISQEQADTLNWLDFHYIIRNVVPGQTKTLYGLDYTTGNFVEIPLSTPNITAAINVYYTKVTSYMLLYKTEETLTYDYIGGALTPIIEQFRYFNRLDIREVTLAKEVVTTTINDVVQNNPLRAWVENGTLHVSGLTASEAWNVYNAAGECIFTNIAGADLQSVPIQSHGLYIIKQGNNAVKAVY